MALLRKPKRPKEKFWRESGSTGQSLPARGYNERAHVCAALPVAPHVRVGRASSPWL